MSNLRIPAVDRAVNTAARNQPRWLAAIALLTAFCSMILLIEEKQVCDEFGYNCYTVTSTTYQSYGYSLLGISALIAVSAGITWLVQNWHRVPTLVATQGYNKPRKR